MTDNLFGTDTETKTLEVRQPGAGRVVHDHPEPGDHRAQTSRSTRAASSDVDGTIAKYEWDLDGNGTYETDTAARAPTTSQTYAASGTVDTRLRRHRQRAAPPGPPRVPVTITSGGVSSYGDAVLDTPGLVNYWRMGEASGPTFADSKGTSHATATGADLRRARGDRAGSESRGTLRRRRRLRQGERQPLRHARS